MDVDAPSPDPQIGEASKESIELARDQFESQQALLNRFSPLYEQQIALNQEQQRKFIDRSDFQDEQYRNLFAPLEGKLAETALNYDSQARRDQAANEAQAGVAGNFQTARQSLTENLAAQSAAGGGRGLALNNALNIQEAVAKAGASNAARQQVESTGLGLVSSAANLGRGFPSQGVQLGQAAQASGQGAMGAVSGLSGLTGAGYNQALQGYGVGINGLTGLYQAQANAAGMQNGIFGDMLGAGAMAYGMYRSSKDAKETGSAVDGKRALAGLADLDVDSWTYKRGEGDGGSHIGPYAEDVNKRFGDEVAPGGEAIDMVKMNEVTAKAISELAEQVAALEQELSGMESKA